VLYISSVPEGGGLGIDKELVTLFKVRKWNRIQNLHRTTLTFYHKKWYCVFTWINDAHGAEHLAMSAFIVLYTHLSVGK